MTGSPSYVTSFHTSAPEPKSKPTPPSDDQGLIRNCVDYARAVAAYHAGFDADPDGDNETASDLSGERLSQRASKLLVEITRTPASTPKGLQAKARIVPAILKDADGASVEDFFAAFASEVKEFLEPFVNG